MEKNFKYVGRWYNSEDIELIELDGEVYALDGWNGDAYYNCWKCTGEYLMDSSKEKYTIQPISEEVDEDEWEVVAYEIL